MHNIYNNIYSEFNKDDFNKKGQQKLMIDNLNIEKPKFLFLNFNYSNTENKYTETTNVKVETIHIHGELNNPPQKAFQ